MAGKQTEEEFYIKKIKKNDNDTPQVIPHGILDQPPFKFPFATEDIILTTDII